jgi:hypothetical protein
MSTTRKVSLENIGQGAAAALLQRELGKVLSNIKDPNTSHKTKREITLKFTLAPYPDRNGAEVTVASSTKLAATSAVETHIFIGKDDQGKLQAFSHDVRQQEMAFEQQQKEEADRAAAEAQRNVAQMPAAVNS